MKVSKSGGKAGSNTKKEKASMNTSFLSIARNAANLNANHTELRNYENINVNFRLDQNLGKTRQTGGDFHRSDLAESFKNTCMDLEGKLNPYSNKSGAVSTYSKNAHIKEL